ncbi:MAG TPA: NADH-ubiquinone oxidoreductase-F iron-sulfur binding region domain-containing protein [Streptosporangiaceae bacterium]|jgi:NADH:ubiquinone oxidoreductase subunit F (NADH-binding)
MTATTVAPGISPTITRLLTGYHETGRAADLGDHLRRHGPPPLSGRSGDGRLIGIIERAGLTGRGGGAFPTARKLHTVADAKRQAVVVVNGGESEPVSGKDRLLLTVAPHLVLDGAALAAEAVGASEIIVCTHSGGDPRTDLRSIVQRAIADRGRARLTTVPTRVTAIPDRYVASEETALVGWLNDGKALPAFTPPRPFERGVGGRPTLISNAETYAHIALIARHGPDWFRSCGAPDAPGTALFTVTGAVRRAGVIEAPLGTPLRDLLGLAGDAAEPLQALLVGGYGGAWLPMELLGTPATPSALRAAGSALGPGIVIALPARACGLAETARVLAWLADQTAGQCGPCVFGLPAIARDFAQIAGCAADRQLYQRLRNRLDVIPGRGACRHPDGAVRLAASALRVFAGHLAAHERSGGCLSARRPGGLPTPGGR